MRIIEQGHEIKHPKIHDPKVAEALLERIESAGRTCYKSENKITPGSAAKFVAMILKRGHDSVLEHESIQVKFVTDRGVTHELVRHRIGIAFSQESTRYCDYAKIIEEEFSCGTDAIIDIDFVEYDGPNITYINPVDFVLDVADLDLMELVEAHYLKCIKNGRSPQQARYFLINGLRTEIRVTANIREWRHIFNLRCSPATHPQMRGLMIPLLNDFSYCIPTLFQDLYQEYGGVYQGKETI